MQILGLSRQEFLWEFPFCEIILCMLANKENNGIKHEWEVLDTGILIMQKMEELENG